ncbi:RNA polymerase sigma factor [Spongiivirga citrea]|uniref:Sigma-70 family RNA polymerase sigma factor n=1 Tax=Spongiivirga citrea TaxID=1481457 RepID=A0A6M0CP30_9FLAO|nr:sigma-70 family RNA polymerase sigma factor [Spongiivirga citrea]NER18693.1 sigma-70 family RNA polymerase sigma factor [Spongiivirga citrea]
MNDLANQDLFSALKNGSELAFKKVYEDNREKFILYAKRYELTDDEVIDIYQDAYIVFHENIVSGKIKQFTSTISTYLFSIGKFMIMDKMRKNNKTIRSEKVMNVVKEEVDINDFEIDATAPTERQLLLKKFFSALGEQCQKILTLFYYRGLTIDEIMEVGNYASKNVVKSQKSRCLKSLKDKINPQ